MMTTQYPAPGCKLPLGAALMALSLSSVSHAADAVDSKEDRAADLEEVIVTGVRASLTEGLAAKRNSTQVIESVVAEDIGKLPDNNVVEAMQRLSGIQVTNRSGGIWSRPLRDLDLQLTYNITPKMSVSSGFARCVGSITTGQLAGDQKL